MIFILFEKHGLVISRKKMKIATKHIKLLGIEIGQEKISLQLHISTKILSFSDNLEDIKTLKVFLRLLNYTRSYLKDIKKISGTLDLIKKN